MGVKLGLSPRGEGHTFRAFEDRVLRRCMQLGGEVITGPGESYAQVMKVCSFYCSQKWSVMMITTRDVRLARRIGRMEEVKNAWEILVGGTKWKRPLGRDNGRRENDIKTYFEGVRLKGCWMGACGWGAGSYEHGNDSYGLVTGNVSISRKALLHAVGYLLEYSSPF